MTPILGILDSAKTGRLSTTTYDLISSYTVPSNTGSVTLSSLGTYDDLIVEIAARTNTTNFDMALTVNANGGITYAYNILFSTGGTNGEAGSGNTLGRAGYNSYGTTASTSYGSTKFYFPNYRRTDRWKTMFWEGFGLIADDTNNFGVGWSMNRAETTAAISTIEFRFSDFGGANVTTGSTFYVYGVNKK